MPKVFELSPKELMNEDLQNIPLDRAAAQASDDLFPFYDDTATPLVLAADDNETHLMFVKRLLTGKGFDCVTTTSPTTAVRIALEKRPALVLCDINFGIGKANGMDVFTEIRKTHPAMPFVLITAFLQPEMEARAAAIGITHYLIKPVEPADLLSTVHNLIGRKRIAS